MADMGPLAKAVAGKAPGGKRLSEKQMKQVKELDEMISGFGKNMGGLGGD